MRGIPPSSCIKMLHPQTWFYILTHAWARRWALHLRGAVLFRRRIRAPDGVEMGRGECRGHDNGQSTVPRFLLLHSAPPVWPVPRDLVAHTKNQVQREVERNQRQKDSV